MMVRRQVVFCMLFAGFVLFPFWAARAGEPSAQIRGVVRSAGETERIPEVDITVSGGGRTWFARTDDDGRFALDVPPGSYDLTLTHPGFDERRLSAIRVAAGDIRKTEITMESGAVEPLVSRGQREEFRAPLPPIEGIEDIVVSAKYVAGSVEQARFSESILDVLGSTDFRITGDTSVVSAMARITGVTIVDDKFVYVRGLGERYSATSFNSAMLPSPDPARRIVPLDLFPSGVMEQLAVQKTWAPYLPADFSGGSLQMKTRSISREPEAKANISLEYNTETTGRRVPWYNGDNTDWTGFEGGFRRFPGTLDALSQDGRLPPPGLLSDADLRTAGLSLDNSYEMSNPIAPPNVAIDYTDGSSVDTSTGRLGWLVGIRYTNDWAFTRETRRTSELNAMSQTVERDHFTKDETDNSVGYSGLATTEWDFLDEQTLQATVFYTRQTDKRFIESTGFLEENAQNVVDTTWEWEERQLWLAQLGGKHFLQDMGDLMLDWNVTFAQASRSKPDSRFFRYEPGESGGLLFSTDSNSNRRQWEELTDNAWDLGLDGEIPLEFADDFLTTFKVGAKYFTKSRTSDLRKFTFRNRFSPTEFDRIRRLAPEGVFADDNIGAGRWELFEITQFTDSYTAEEQIAALYGQAETEIGTAWRLMWGARYETSRQQTETRAVRGGNPVVAKLGKGFLLPAASLTWSFREDMQLRAAYSQTINRPDLREISPASYLDAEDRDVFVGNTKLQIAEITNYDLRWEWYHGLRDSLQLALFYKEFKDPIEETLLLRGSTVLRTYQNAEVAQLYGVELTLRQTLETLSPRLENFYVKLNGALIDSEVKVGPEAFNQTNQKRQLQGQSPWATNFQLTYEALEPDLQATIAGNASGERIADVGVNGLDDAKDQTVLRVDFILGYGFELWGRSMKIQFQAKNLLDPAIERTRDGVTERTFHRGRNFKVGWEVSL